MTDTTIDIVLVEIQDEQVSLRIVLLENGPWEYYCHGCKQLRLYAIGGKPLFCTQCKCTNIEVDKPGSERLGELRFGRGKNG